MKIVNCINYKEGIQTKLGGKIINLYLDNECIFFPKKVLHFKAFGKTQVNVIIKEFKRCKLIDGVLKLNYKINLLDQLIIHVNTYYTYEWDTVYQKFKVNKKK